MENLRDEFESEVETFLANSEMSATAFGRAAVNDPSFVARLKRKRDFGISVVDRVRQYIREHGEA